MENKHVFVVFVENYNDHYSFIYFLLKEKYNENTRNKYCVWKSSCLFYIEHKKTFCIVTTIDQFFNLHHTYYLLSYIINSFFLKRKIWMSNLKIIELILWFCKYYYCYSILLNVLPPFHLVLLFFFNVFFIFDIQYFCNLLLFSNMFGLIPRICLTMFILSMFFILISCLASFKSWNSQAIDIEL